MACVFLEVLRGTGGAKGKLVEAISPAGVMKVVKRCEDFNRGICQKPLLASNFVKTLAPLSCERVSSTLGSGWISLNYKWYTFVERFKIHVYTDST